MKAYLDTEHYAEIDLGEMTFTVKRFTVENDVGKGMSPLNENMTLTELKRFIEIQKSFLK